MFIRVKTTPNSPRKSIQIVESTRVGDKIRQKIVRYVGIAMDDQEEAKLKDLAVTIIEKLLAERYETAPQKDMFTPPTLEELKTHFSQKTGRRPQKRLEDILPPSQVPLDQVVEEARVVEGVHEIAGAVYEQLGYANLLRTPRARQALQDLVLARLVYPCSKYKTQKILERQFKQPHALNSLYRVMDKVYTQIDTIKQRTFLSTQSLFPRGVDLMLFDVTTLYFESTEVDDLRKYGYSKDHRFNTTQVVLALATNGDGLPVGYELFEGNKAEVKTLFASIDAWKKLFNIDNVCFVGDRAMFSKENVALLEERKYHYVIAAKLRALPKELQKEVLDITHYQSMTTGDASSRIAEFTYQGQRLIVSYKKTRADKDASDRARILNKITKVIGAQGDTEKLISNHGVKKYTSTNEAAQTTLDTDKIAADAQWDGLHGIITNIQEAAPLDLLKKYARLWVIEESFRINKHTLQMRPIFHWKPERIKAHIAICYMTFSVLRHLEYRVSLTQKLSVQTILDELNQVQASIYIHKKTKDRYRVPGVFSNEARKIYKALSLERSLDAEIYLK
jgi:transposase